MHGSLAPSYLSLWLLQPVALVSVTSDIWTVHLDVRYAMVSLEFCTVQLIPRPKQAHSRIFLGYYCALWTNKQKHRNDDRRLDCGGFPPPPGHAGLFLVFV